MTIDRRRAVWIAAMLVGVLGPLLVAVGAIVIAARGTAVPIELAAAVALLAPAAAIAVLVKRSRPIGGAALIANLAVALFLRTYGAAPLPEPPPFAGPLPAASPPPGVALFQLPTGVIHRTAAFGYRGGAFSDHR